MVTKVVRKDKSPEARVAAKKAKLYRNKNKSKLNKVAKNRYKTMTHGEKLAHLENSVFLRAMRHGATEAEAKKAVAAYKKNRKMRHAGKHASEQKRQAVTAQKSIRGQLKAKSQAVSGAHKKALMKIRTAKVAPAVRMKMRAAEKQRYASERKTLAGERMKAVKTHQKSLGKIKAASAKRGVFRLKDFIGNFSAKPISKKGKRLKTIDPKKAAAAKVASQKETSAISTKHFGKTGGAVKKTRKVPAAKTAAPAAEAAPAKKRGRPAKPKADAAPAPVAKKRGRPAKPKTEAAAPAAPAKKRGRPAKVKTEVAAAPAAAPKKRGRPAKAKPAETAAAPVAKKRGRPAKAKEAPKAEAAPAKKRGRPAKVKEAAAAPAAPAKKRGRPAKAKEAAAPAAAAPKKRGRPAKVKEAAAPAKAPAKAAKAPKAAAKAAPKKAAKPAAKAAPAKAAAKPKGGAVPKKSAGNKKASFG